MIPGLCNLFQAKTGASGGMTVSATPTNVTTIGNGIQDSAIITATPMGGTAPYTYSWGGLVDPGITILTPLTATTRCSATVSPSDYLQGMLACFVTDNLGNTAYSNDVTVIFQGNS